MLSSQISENGNNTSKALNKERMETRKALLNRGRMWSKAKNMY